MQYVQRKLQRSVTEIRRSSATRPNVSTSGPEVGIDVTMRRQPTAEAREGAS
jgi:hypothetical protein